MTTNNELDTLMAVEVMKRTDIRYEMGLVFYRSDNGNDIAFAPTKCMNQAMECVEAMGDYEVEITIWRKMNDEGHPAMVDVTVSAWNGGDSFLEQASLAELPLAIVKAIAKAKGLTK